MIDLNNYGQIIYVDAINGDDTIGDGSSNNPYASVIKAVNSATLDNTLIYLKEGIYAIKNGLSSTIRTNIKLTFFGETVLDRDKKVIFDLQATYQNHPKMTKQHTYIGIVFKRSGIASGIYNDSRLYEYFGDSSTLNIQFKNCVFDVGDIIPSDYIIFTGHINGCTIVKLEYINCSIIPNNLSGKKGSKIRGGNFINCAIADSDLTTDMPNQLSSTFNYNYELINPRGEYGVYFGEYAWKRYINKTLILHDGKYKKINKGKPALPPSNILPIFKGYSEGNMTISESSHYEDNYAYLAVDKNSKTYWVSDGFPNENQPQWIMIDLGEPKTLIGYGISIMAYMIYNIGAHHFEISNDGNTFSRVYTHKEPLSDQKLTYFYFSPVTCRYIRILITRHFGNNRRVSIKELELIGEGEKEVLPFWEVVNVTLPTINQFLNDGVDDLSIINREIKQLEPMQMEDKTNILFTNNEQGKVFSKTIDLKKYFDIRSMKVEVK